MGETDHEGTTEAKESSKKSSRKSSIDAGDAEADNEKESLEAEKEDSADKDNSLADDKSEKENAPETVFEVPPVFETDKFHQIPEDKSPLDYPKYGEELTPIQDDKLPVGLEENKQEEVKTLEEVTGSHNDGEDASEAQHKEVSTIAPEKKDSMEPENEVTSREHKDVSSTDEKYGEEENKDTDMEEIHKNAS